MWFGDPRWGICGMPSVTTISDNTLTVGYMDVVKTNTVYYDFEKQQLRERIRLLEEQCAMKRLVQTSHTTNAASSQPQRSSTMLADFMTADLTTCALDALLAYSAYAKLLVAEYTARGLDVPDDIAKRQRVIAREIGRAIEAEIDKLDAEDKALQEKEQKRKAVQAQREKLREALRQ